MWLRKLHYALPEVSGFFNKHPSYHFYLEVLPPTPTPLLTIVAKEIHVYVNSETDKTCGTTERNLVFSQVEATNWILSSLKRIPLTHQR